jgi:hypothetical protein
LLRTEIESDLHWSAVILGVIPEGSFCLLDNCFVLNDECKIDTVPKNAKTNRVIAIENRGNSFLQKGFGGYFRRRLRKVGVDLDDQEINQERARLAYSRNLATLDLRAASDTISIEAVWLLLPYDWAASLDAVRSRYAVMPNGDRMKLEKFSSMGNGFTFELESLIFWALAQVVSDEGSGERVSVYGDDIICSSQDYDELVSLLDHCGFEVNKSKSYSHGLFFESCGKHFFQGSDVTPAYQKEIVASGSEFSLEAKRLANRLLRLGLRMNVGLGIDRTVEPAWRLLRRVFYDGTFIPFSPQGDDGWALLEEDFPKIPLRGSRGFERYFVCRVHRIPQKAFPAHEGSLLAWSLRRGVKTETPYGGNLTIASKNLTTLGYRKVIPCGDFLLTWH